MKETLVSKAASSRVEGANTGEEAARAVARMRAAVGDRELLAHYTQATLRENGLSYHDQEFHTGLTASTVYNMALGKETGSRAVQQFAAFAAYRGGCAETRDYWKRLLERLRAENAAPLVQADSGDAPAALSAAPEEVAALYARLRDPGSRRAVADLLNLLYAAEADQGIPEASAAC